MSDWFAKIMTKFFRFIADTFFAKRYGHRAVVLETIAGVPGIVAGVWLHMKSLRKMEAGLGPKIREMMAEAENEVAAVDDIVASDDPYAVAITDTSSGSEIEDAIARWEQYDVDIDEAIDEAMAQDEVVSAVFKSLECL